MTELQGQWFSFWKMLSGQDFDSQEFKKRKKKKQNTNKKLQQAAKPNQVKKNFKQNKQEGWEMRNIFFCKHLTSLVNF